MCSHMMGFHLSVRLLLGNLSRSINPGSHVFCVAWSHDDKTSDYGFSMGPHSSLRPAHSLTSAYALQAYTQLKRLSSSQSTCCSIALSLYMEVIQLDTVRGASLLAWGRVLCPLYSAVEPLYKGQVGGESFVPYTVEPLSKGQVGDGSFVSGASLQGTSWGWVLCPLYSGASLQGTSWGPLYGGASLQGTSWG